MSKPIPEKDLSQMQQIATECNTEKNMPGPIAHMSMHDQGLSQRQFAAIVLMLQGLSDERVGQQIGVNRTTLFRWRQNEEFATELAYRRQQIWRQSLERLQSLLEPALDVLQKQLSGDDPKTALRAASIMLRIASPSRIERLNNPDSRSHSQSSDPEWDAIEAYINAPMPGEPGHPATDREEED